MVKKERSKGTRWYLRVGWASSRCKTKRVRRARHRVMGGGWRAQDKGGDALEEGSEGLDDNGRDPRGTRPGAREGDIQLALDGERQHEPEGALLEQLLDLLDREDGVAEGVVGGDIVLVEDLEVAAACRASRRLWTTKTASRPQRDNAWPVRKTTVSMLENTGAVQVLSASIPMGASSSRGRILRLSVLVLAQPLRVNVLHRHNRTIMTRTPDNHQKIRHRRAILSECNSVR